MPKVSVVIPVYNTEKFLKQCIDSIINQTLKDIEIICVNDGSTDNSLEILKTYANNDKRIIIINQNNKGAAAARNAGIALAKAKYLAILDSDDIYDVTMLEKMYKKSEEFGLDINICRSQGLNNCTQKIIPTDWVLKVQYIPKKIFNRNDIYAHMFDFCIGWSWDKLYNRKFVVSNKLKFQCIKNTDDAFFVFLSLVLAEKISYIDEILVTHRRNVGTSVSGTLDKSPLCFLKAIKQLYLQLKKRRLYSQLEQAFINWSVDFCFWNLSQLNEENSKMLENLLKTKVFKELNAYSKGKEYFYNESYFYRVQAYKTEYEKLQRDSKERKKELLQGIFSVKNSENKTHKIITILGIKLKLRRKNG